MRRVAPWLLAVAIAIGALALAIIAVPLAEYDPPSGGTASDETVTVTSRNSDLAVPASVTLSWSRERLVRLTSASGLVTSVSARPGERVACGAEVLRLDGRAVVTYCGPQPLYRELSSSTTGDDVTEFVAFLQSLGYLAEVEGDPDPDALDQAFRDVQEQFGWSVTGTIDPGGLLWIRSPITPTTVDVDPGMLVDPGATVFTVAASLTSATANPANVADEGGEIVFGLDGSPERFTVGRDGAVEQLRRLSVALQVAGMLRDGLPATAVGAVRLRQPIAVLSIAASSVLTGDTGECVAVVSEGDERLVDVRVIGSSVGSVYVAGQLSAGDEVRVEPDRSKAC